ncbi:MAG TPA: hypothetical protein VK479_10980 [Micropepsaceae bacterium]|nr:hypothetical protein [Micropepsaceae bacterium]
MSSGKFASLTPNLLVRKGEAAPSPITPSPTASGPARPFARAIERVEGRTSAHPTQQVHQPAWQNGPQRAPEWQDLPPRVDAPERVFVQSAREIALHSDHPDKPRRLMVSLSSEEYEMLGIIGVKKSVTRHQLLRIAFDEYLLQLVEEFGEGCNCVANGGSCDAPC